MSINSKPNWGAALIENGVATDRMQLFFDDLAQLLNANLLGLQVQLPVYTVATLPTAENQAGMIFVSDETGGAVPAFSDGTNFRRVTDRAIVS